jgi:DNA polymerase-3 subunit alpha
LDNFKIEMQNFCNTTVSDLKNNMARLKNKDISIGGLIAEANHRVSKTGKPFGTFILEDYNESIDLPLFGEDYVRFKAFLNTGYFIHLKGKVQERFHQPDNLEFKVSSVQLLGDLREKLAKSITINIPLNRVTDNFIDEIKNMLEANPGTCTVKFSVYDNDENIKIDMPSKKTKVNLSNELIQLLESRKELSFKLN